METGLEVVRCPWCTHLLEEHVAGFPCACPNCLAVWDFPGSESFEPEEAPGIVQLKGAARDDVRAAAVLERMYGSIRSLAVIPEVPQRVISMVHDPLSNVSDAAALIRDDAVLTMGVLRLANSVAYAGREKIQDLVVGCSRIGLKGIANLMWSALNASFYNNGPAPFRAWMSRLWKHSVASAACAEMLAQAMHVREDHVAYVGALLHDAGKVVLLQAISNLPPAACAAFVASPVETETLLRNYHAAAGLHAVQYMKSAHEVRLTTLYHHCPEVLTDPAMAQLTLIVACANTLATQAGYGAYMTTPEMDSEVPGQAMFSELGIDEDTITAIMDALPERLEGTLSTFSVD